MAQGGGASQSGNNVFAYAILLLACFFGVQLLYDTHASEINSVIMAIHKGLLFPFTFIPNSNAAVIWQRFHWEAPWHYQWHHMMVLAEQTGRYWRWLFLPFMVYWSIRIIVKQDLDARYQRLFSMRKLIENNVNQFPCMAPITKVNILELPYHEGPWRFLMQPLQFAVVHQLILDKHDKPVPNEWLIIAKTKLPNDRSPLLSGDIVGVHLDRVKAIRLFELQLGTAFKGVDGLPPHLRGLAAAFMAFGMGNKVAGQGLLDHMSLSFTCNEKGGAPSLDITGADPLIRQYANAHEVLEATEYHTAYTATWLIALLVFARKKGVLAVSQFIWLRPTDHQMFCTLDQVGGKRPWSSAIGPWVHYDHECLAEQTLYTPDMASAANDFEQEIYELGYMR